MTGPGKRIRRVKVVNRAKGRTPSNVSKIARVVTPDQKKAIADSMLTAVTTQFHYTSPRDVQASDILIVLRVLGFNEATVSLNMVKNTFKRADRMSIPMYRVLKKVKADTQFKFNISLEGFKALSIVKKKKETAAAGEPSAASAPSAPIIVSSTQSIRRHFTPQAFYAAVPAFLIWAHSEGLNVTTLCQDTLLRFKLQVNSFIDECEENSIIMKGDWARLKGDPAGFRTDLCKHMSRVSPPVITID